MLGHVATSLTSSLPGGGGQSFIGQVLVTGSGDTSTTTPDGAFFVFAEAIGTGGAAIGAGVSYSAGGAGSDAILALTPGQAIVSNLSAFNTSSPSATTISLVSVVQVTAASAPSSTSGTAVAVAGKYPGTAGGSGVTNSGKGGGRLAGTPTSNPANNAHAAPTGCGRYGSGIQLYGGRPLVCLTFFTTYDATLAFANSLYGGAWAP